jgi:Pectate lyase superfamily protein
MVDGFPSGFNRAQNQLGTTGQPAVVYFPAGTYSISSPLQLYVGTVLMGNPLNLPIIKASSSFNGDTMIYGKDLNQNSTINFYIGIKNLVIDSTAVDKSKVFSLLDWSVSQATQLANIVFQMPNFSTGHTVSLKPLQTSILPIPRWGRPENVCQMIVISTSFMKIAGREWVCVLILVQGIVMAEDGSGTMMGDLTFKGGMELVFKPVHSTQ